MNKGREAAEARPDMPGYIRCIRAAAVKLTAVLLALVLALPAAGQLLSEPAYAASEFRLGQARSGENGAKGNKPGDQSGREVYVGGWEYSFFSFGSCHWEYVLRPKDHKIARQIAADMKKACENDCIGYDQDSFDRGTFYDEALTHNWDISAVDRKCETTCTNIISVCLNAAGIEVPRLWMSGSVKKDLMATGQFELFETSDYTTSPDKLLPGDILVNPGKHTAMVIESPNPFTYPVNYINAAGKKKTVEIEEDTNIRLNYNNGEALKKIKVTGEIDLSEEVPEKNGYEFTGWQKAGGRGFSAQYKGKIPYIETENKKEDFSAEE